MSEVSEVKRKNLMLGGINPSNITIKKMELGSPQGLLASNPLWRPIKGVNRADKIMC